MKTLFVSDLDGTLLRSDETLSQFTIDTINGLTEKGMLFSYATARSLVTAKKVTKGLNSHIPVIVYNGTFVMDNVTEEILIANYFDDGIYDVFCDLFKEGIYPIVYSYIDGIEKFSYIPEKCTEGMKVFLNTRKGDKRTNKVGTIEELTAGKCFYITCIDEPEKLEPFSKKYKDRYRVIYSKDVYSEFQWLEIMPKAASKANAILQLKERLGCDRIVSFGDGENDIDMFRISDEAYAVDNAVESLKKVATGIIGSNNDDGVAKWLRANMGRL
ncbi:MAG TPA: Cof-type HAD-IIB family hydrolase [Hungateiclostridium thermocellum]|uniref:Cof-like hydrolase n=2 Tax=Acetivibrio thermocellus TaxID=1515 RepID=A3DFI2_ACET2|nr:Cof-type HAD-IIB family hydrolase [Acetivibrio thermocellus]CDG36147.1 Cof-like hydrolase [Acetivibrio thermocellus BC1]ABN52711.1 Cof-like hydrolase [Acetivibrio thermocellus ATCC 27405]ADU75276.1 Cof-like hydrolase [Acetivibrio thermocellus DSM 1313]ALX09265.1 Cof-like hydrolase [Acetivibrio thermocellus AD2]ANV77017.1 Cof-like hydrolase [Acetivibrio thermocellus DSM 2360]